MWPRLELMLQLCAGVGALIQSGTLYLRRAQAPLYERFSIALFLIGVVFLGKAYWGWSGGGGTTGLIIGHLYTFAMTLIPISLVLVVEQMLPRPLHLASKLFWLIGTVILSVTSISTWSETSGWWEVAFQLYFSLSVLILLVYLFGAWRQQRPGPRKSLYAGLLIVGVLAPLLVFTDSADILGWRAPQLAAIPVILLTYLSSYSLRAAGQWRLLRAVQDLAGVTVVLVGVLACAAYVLPLSAGALVTLMVLALVVFMSVRPLLSGWIMRRDRRADVLFDRLSGLPTHSRAAFVARVAGWPELRQVALADLSAFTEVERAGVYRYLDVQGVAERQVVQEALLLGPPAGQARVLEQVLFLLDQHEVDYLVSIGGAEALLGVRFEVGLEATVYRRVLSVFALIAHRLPADPLRSAVSDD
ncbi:MAG: hypothetical protein AAFV53_08335 [Myxococcota bacterium]